VVRDQLSFFFFILILSTHVPRNPHHVPLDVEGVQPPLPLFLVLILLPSDAFTSCLPCFSSSSQSSPFSIGRWKTKRLGGGRDAGVQKAGNASQGRRTRGKGRRCGLHRGEEGGKGGDQATLLARLCSRTYACACFWCTVGVGRGRRCERGVVQDWRVWGGLRSSSSSQEARMLAGLARQDEMEGERRPREYPCICACVACVRAPA
jgi:hypothetical protein